MSIVTFLLFPPATILPTGVRGMASKPDSQRSQMHALDEAHLAAIKAFLGRMEQAGTPVSLDDLLRAPQGKGSALELIALYRSQRSERTALQKSFRKG